MTMSKHTVLVLYRNGDVKCQHGMCLFRLYATEYNTAAESSCVGEYNVYTCVILIFVCSLMLPCSQQIHPSLPTLSFPLAFC